MEKKPIKEELKQFFQTKHEQLFYLILPIIIICFGVFVLIINLFSLEIFQLAFLNGILVGMVVFLGFVYITDAKSKKKEIKKNEKRKA